MSNYSFKVITIIFSTQTRPRCRFSTLFPTRGLIVFDEAFPASVVTHTTVPSRNPERRKTRLSLPWGTAHHHHWSRTELFSAFLSCGGCCLPAGLWDVLLVFSIPDWDLQSGALCVLPYRWAPTYAECVFACGFFFLCVCVWARVPVIHTFLHPPLHYLRWHNCFPLLI